MGQTIRTTVRLPESLLARAKDKARERKTTLTALLEEGLSLVLNRSVTQEDERKLYVPRVSSAKGGLRPGVRSLKTSDLLEIDNEDLPLEKQR
ncbi:MAG: hypothetical protein AB7S41_04360 [Parvibaculaceae bacterium]